MADETKTTTTPASVTAEPTMPPSHPEAPMAENFMPNTSSMSEATVGNASATQKPSAGASTAAGNAFGSNAKQAGSTAQKASAGNVDLIMSIPVEVQVVLGGTTMPVATLMELGRGAVITLDKQIGDPVDIVVNGRVIARGEVIVMEDDSSRFGVSLTEIIGN
ncbi:flagellar motor switch protein FliN [uncultured Bartonella sp.]|uniref:flagellar motor switch protein FliN n=1 Tax=uncultured Bartonella sp. TaxID=104108 RepID=UPI002607A859|nr:flagellar motor switch protein FliN [uncultured Bartonella sp.]